jgi:hypothetical protein
VAAPKPGRPYGLPLSEAAHRYASPGLRRRFKGPPVAEVIQQIKERSTGEGGDRWISALTTVNEGINRMRTRDEAQEQMRRSLLLKLQRGQLVATGLAEHLDGAAQREPIEEPELLFQMEFADWRESALVGRGYDYTLVEVFKPDVVKPQFKPVNYSVAPTRPKLPVVHERGAVSAKRSVGRPNVRKWVAEIAGEIMDDPDFNQPKFDNELFSQIRAIGAVKYPNNFSETEPKDQTIRNGLSDAKLIRFNK